ncbi:MAG: hypothetical protein ACLTXH_06925 [Enterobacter hormaechei]
MPTRTSNVSGGTSGVKEIREAITCAQNRNAGRRTISRDEVHRFNKSQQDAFRH